MSLIIKKEYKGFKEGDKVFSKYSNPENRKCGTIDSFWFWNNEPVEVHLKETNYKWSISSLKRCK